MGLGHLPNKASAQRKNLPNHYSQDTHPAPVNTIVCVYVAFSCARKPCLGRCIFSTVKTTLFSVSYA